MKTLIASYWVLLLIVVMSSAHVRAQVVTNHGSLKISNGTIMTISGSYEHKSGSLEIESGGEFLLSGNLLNTSAGQVTNGLSGVIKFAGVEPQSINSGPGVLFHKLSVENSNDEAISVTGDIDIANILDLVQGNMDIHANSLQLVTLPAGSPTPVTEGLLRNETDDHKILSAGGKILSAARYYDSDDLINPVNIGGLGIELSITDFGGGNISVQRHHQIQSANANGESIGRAFLIDAPPLNGALAAIRFNYFDSDLATLASREDEFRLFRSADDGQSWTLQPGTVNSAGNYVEADDITELAGLWTISYCIPPLVSLGEDLSVCPAGSASIEAEVNGTGPFVYQWLTEGIPLPDETAARIDIHVDTDPQQFALIVTDARGCTMTDEVQIGIKARPEFELGADLSVCANEEAILDAGPDFVGYQWFNAAGEKIGDQRTLPVDAAGQYKAVITDISGCGNEDLINVLHHPIPVSNLSSNSPTCGDEIVLGTGLEEINSGATYLWRDPEGTPIGAQATITINQAGFYEVVITADNGCQVASGTNVSLNAAEFVDLGPDITIACASATVDAGNPGSSFLWSTGETSQFITIDEAGSYTVTVTHPSGCEDSDEIVINLLPVLDSAFYLSATEASVNDSIYFIGLTTQETSSVTWDFKDQVIEEGNALITAHAYAAAGKYDPEMITTFMNGCVDSYAKRVTITEIRDGNSGGRIAGENIISNVDIYPNPNNGQFKAGVKLSQKTRVSFAIISLNGDAVTEPLIVEDAAHYEAEFDIRTVVSGVYILLIRAGDEARQYRVVKSW